VGFDKATFPGIYYGIPDTQPIVWRHWMLLWQISNSIECHFLWKFKQSVIYPQQLQPFNYLRTTWI